MTDFVQTVENDAVEALQKFENFFEQDVWPYAKAFFLTLLQQEGKDALKAAVVALPIALAGNPAAAAAQVAAAVAGSLAANAAADAQVEISAAVANAAALTDATGVSTPVS